MVAAAVRSAVFMPRDWWIVERTPPPESFGQAIRRLRLEMGARLGRDVDQEEVRKAVGVSQSSMSDYETGKTVPSRRVIHQFNEYFALPLNTLRDIAREYEDWEDAQRRHPLPGPSVAVPNGPEVVDLLNAAAKLELSQFPDATKQLLKIAKGPIPRGTAHEEPPG